MDASPRTHYQVLGIGRNAKAHDIRRAYDRLRAEMQEEAAAPDPRRVVQLQTAYEVLCDDARRQAYDRSLRLGPARRSRRRVASIGAASAIAIAIGVAAWIAMRPAAPPAKSATEILSAATLAVGRFDAVDIGGHLTPLGLAFAIEEGRLAVACPATPPDAQLLVRIGTRDAPARLDPRPAGQPYCTLSAPQTGSWPLALASAAPAEGDKVYEVRVAPDGQATLAEGRMGRIERREGFAVLEVSGAAAAAQAGAPLLDGQGRVVAIGDARGRHLRISAAAEPRK